MPTRRASTPAGPPPTAPFTIRGGSDCDQSEGVLWVGSSSGPSTRLCFQAWAETYELTGKREGTRVTASLQTGWYGESVEIEIDLRERSAHVKYKPAGAQRYYHYWLPNDD